jgi:polygalacturonase
MGAAMTRIRMERRNFFKTAGKAALAAPVLSALGGCDRALRPVRTAAQPAPPVPDPSLAAAGPKVTINVRDLGATGDGKTKDTLAIQQTIERCSVLGGGEVVVPAGDYLTGALALRSNVTLRIEDGASLLGSPDMADYPLAQVRWEGHWIKGYVGFVSATDAENIAIVGPGKIVGSPSERGRVGRPSGFRLPALLEFNNCRNVRVQDLDTRQYGMWSIHPVYCENVTFKNVSVKSGADGIDVDSCKHTIIDGCTFETGDDSISLKSGRGAEGNTIGRPCEDVLITNCTLSDAGFANIGIGSETSAGVKNVRIEHCKFISARSFAIFIKTRTGRGAYIEDISATDLDVSGMRQGFLQISVLGVGKADVDSVYGDEGIPTLKNFRFSNVRVVDVPVLVDAVNIHPKKPLEGFVLENVTGTATKGIALANIRNAHLSGIKVTGVAGPMLSTFGVTGTGLTGAVAISGPVDGPRVQLEPVPAPATPYRLH